MISGYLTESLRFMTSVGKRSKQERVTLTDLKHWYSFTLKISLFCVYLSCLMKQPLSLH